MPLPSITLLSPPSPPNNSVVTTSSVTIQWQFYTGALNYLIYVQEANLASNNWVDFYIGVQPGAYTIHSIINLVPSRQYRWQVIACDGNGDYIAQSPLWTFETLSSVPASAPVIITSPAANSQLSFSSPSVYINIVWQAYTNATRYEVWVVFGASISSLGKVGAPANVTAPTTSYTANYNFNSSIQQSVYAAVYVDAYNGSTFLATNNTHIFVIRYTPNTPTPYIYEIEISTNNVNYTPVNSVTFNYTIPYTTGTVFLKIYTSGSCVLSSNAPVSWFYEKITLLTNYIIFVEDQKIIEFEFEYNTGSARSTTILITAPDGSIVREINITQSASPIQPSCSYLLSSSVGGTFAGTLYTIEVSYLKTGVEFNVVPNLGCNWRIEIDSSNTNFPLTVNPTTWQNTLGSVFVDFNANSSSSVKVYKLKLVSPTSLIYNIEIVQAAYNPPPPPVQRSLQGKVYTNLQPSRLFVERGSTSYHAKQHLYISPTANFEASYIRVEITVTPSTTRWTAYSSMILPNAQSFQGNALISLQGYSPTMDPQTFRAKTSDGYLYELVIFSEEFPTTKFISPVNNSSFYTNQTIHIKWSIEEVFIPNLSTSPPWSKVFLFYGPSGRTGFTLTSKYPSQYSAIVNGYCEFEHNLDLTVFLSSLNQQQREQFINNPIKLELWAYYIKNFYAYDFKLEDFLTITVSEPTSVPIEEEPFEPAPDLQNGKIIKHVFQNVRTKCTHEDALSEPLTLIFHEIIGTPPFDSVEQLEFRYSEQDLSTISLLTSSPVFSINKGGGVLRTSPEHAVVTLPLSETFPADFVFNNLLKGENVIVIAEIRNDSGYCFQGIVEPNVNITFEDVYRQINILDVSRGVEKKEFVRRIEPTNLNVVHLANWFKVESAIDNHSQKIEYGLNSSTGKSLVDYLYKNTNRGEMIRIIDLMQLISDYINKESVFAETGIIENPTNSATLVVIGANEIGYYERTSSHASVMHDLLCAYIHLDSFILSDHYGPTTTKALSGITRDWTVERTRGLKDENGKWGKGEAKYSFITKTVAEVISAIAASTGYNVLFESCLESNKPFIRIVLHRNYSTHTFALNNTNNTFEQNTSVVYGLDSYETESENWKTKVSFKRVVVDKVEVKEINGKGTERVENACYNDIYVPAEIKYPVTNFERYFSLKEESKELIFASLRIDPLTLEGAVAKRTIELPNDNALTAEESQFYARLIYQNLLFSTNEQNFIQNERNFTVTINAPLFYFVKTNDGVPVAKYTLADAIAESIAIFETRSRLEIDVELLVHLESYNINLYNIVRILREGTSVQFYDCEIMNLDLDIGKPFVKLKVAAIKSGERLSDVSLAPPGSELKLIPVLPVNPNVPSRRESVFSLNGDTTLYPADSGGQFAQFWKGQKLEWNVPNATDTKIEIKRDSSTILSISVPTTTTQIADNIYRRLYASNGLHTIVLSGIVSGRKTLIASSAYQVFRGFLRLEEIGGINWGDVSPVKNIALVNNEYTVTLKFQAEWLETDFLISFGTNGISFRSDGVIWQFKKQILATDDVRYYEMGQNKKPIGQGKPVTITIDVNDGNMTSLKINEELILPSEFKVASENLPYTTPPGIHNKASSSNQAASKIHVDYIYVDLLNPTSSTPPEVVREFFSFKLFEASDKIFVDDFRNFGKF